MGDNSRWFQDHPLKTVGGIVFTRICYICKYLNKGHNSVRKGGLTNSSFNAQLRKMNDNPRFQDHPLKTVGVVFTRIC